MARGGMARTRMAGSQPMGPEFPVGLPEKFVDLESRKKWNRGNRKSGR